MHKQQTNRGRKMRPTNDVEFGTLRSNSDQVAWTKRATGMILYSYPIFSQLQKSSNVVCGKLVLQIVPDSGAEYGDHGLNRSK